MRYVVCGPPGAGKTTWVEQRRQPGDVVFDVDAIGAAVFGMPQAPRPAPVERCLALMRDALILWTIRSGFSGIVETFVIAGDPHLAADIAHRLRAELVLLPSRPPVDVDACGNTEAS